MDECVEHFLPDCAVLLHVPLQPVRPPIVGNGSFRRAGLHRRGPRRHYDAHRRQSCEESRRCTHARRRLPRRADGRGSSASSGSGFEVAPQWNRTAHTFSPRTSRCLTVASFIGPVQTPKVLAQFASQRRTPPWGSTRLVCFA